MYKYCMAIRFAPPAPKPAVMGIPISKPSRKGIGGRPRKADALMAVTLRLHPDVVAAFKAGGDDWRSRMAEALERAC